MHCAEEQRIKYYYLAKSMYKILYMHVYNATLPTVKVVDLEGICDVEEYDEVADDAFECDHEQNIDRAQSALF